MLNGEFEKMPLKVHKFLAGVRLHSLHRLELPGGPAGLNIREITELTGLNTEKAQIGFVTEALFWLRGFIGRVFGWDNDDKLTESVSYLSRLTGEDRAKSLVEPGKAEGISRVLYCFENELLAEIVNHTVHCFWVAASERTPNGYVLWMAVYVKKLNWFTPVYMTLVSPVLKWIIYPSLEKSILRSWKDAFPATPGKPVSTSAAMVK